MIYEADNGTIFEFVDHGWHGCPCVNVLPKLESPFTITLDAFCTTIKEVIDIRKRECQKKQLGS